MICSKCHQEVRPDAKFCDNCGIPVAQPVAEAELTCLVCGEKIESGSAFCPKCGMPSVASQTDMTVVLPKSAILKKDAPPEPSVDAAFPSLDSPDDDVTRVIVPPQKRVAEGEGMSTPPLVKPVAQPAAAGRPAVPKASSSSSSEETIMVLNPPPAKPARPAGAPKPEGGKEGKVSAGMASPRKSSRSAADSKRDTKRSSEKSGKRQSNTMLIGGIVGVVVILVAVVVAWGLKPHRARKPAEAPVAVSSPAAEPGPSGASFPVVATQSQVAPQPVQSAVTPVDSVVNQAAAPQGSDMKTEKRPALILAPSMSGNTEAAQAPEKAADQAPEKSAEKAEKPEGQESARAATAKPSRKQTKAVPKQNKEDDYLRQIHRQLDRQG